MGVIRSHRPRLELSLSVVPINPRSPMSEVLSLPQEQKRPRQNEQADGTNSIEHRRHPHSIDPWRDGEHPNCGEEITDESQTCQGVSDDLVVGVDHISECNGLKRRGAKGAKAVCYGHLVPGLAFRKSISEPKRTSNLERDEWHEGPESHFRLVDSFVPLRQP